VLSLDEGTTGATAVVVGLDGEVRSTGYQEIAQHYPQPGWVEHDPLEIWSAVKLSAKEALLGAGVTAQVLGVATGIAGRIWVMWGDASGGGIAVTRSNKAVTKWEPVQKIALPKNTTAFYNAQGEGSGGPLDAFVDLLLGTNDRGFWRTHVLARDSLSESTSFQSGGKGKSAKLAFHATDAGDPLSGAIIVVARGSTVLARLKTDPNGHAAMSLPVGNRNGSLKATVTAPGYSAQTISVGLGG